MNEGQQRRGGMRIAIDARWIFPEISGIGHYTQELVRAFAHEDRDNEYLLFFQRRALRDRTAEATGFSAAPNFTTHLVPYGLFSVRNQLLMPGLLSDLRVQVYHAPNYLVPLRAFPTHRRGHTRCVTTIHDLIPLLFPEQTPRSKKTRLLPVFRRLLKECARRSNVILTVSESSRRDIIRHLALPPDRAADVAVVPNGVAPVFAPGATRMGDPKTILYVGRFDPYKNVTMLVEAYAALKASLPDLRLRIIGPEDERYPEARLRARALGVESAITWSGYVPVEDLRQAYQDAQVLVLPSRYEGFGLPVAEAMACGTPVVCSNRSSLPEVAGDAALLVDPDRPEELVEALTRVLSDSSLARSLRARGLEQARRFTWTHAAELTRQAYRRALA